MWWKCNSLVLSSLLLLANYTTALVVHTPEKPRITFRQAPGAEDVVPIEQLFALIPLVILAVEAPLRIVHLAFIIANLVLVSLERRDLTENLAEAEQVMENLSGITATRRRGLLPMTNVSSNKAGMKEENETFQIISPFLHKEGYPLEITQKPLKIPILLAAIGLATYGFLQIGPFPTIVAGALSYFLLKNSDSLKSQNHFSEIKRSFFASAR